MAKLARYKEDLDDALEKGWAGQPQQPKEEEKKRKKEITAKMPQSPRRQCSMLHVDNA